MRAQPNSLDLAALERNGKPARAAFTLIEMMVSLAVLAVALAVIGVVFNVTVRVTRQAAALSELQARLRQFEVQLREDLRGCDPARSILVLVGRTQAAALTADDIAARKYFRVLTGDPSQVPAGYDPQYSPVLDPNYSNPRADILMFFTNRPIASQAPPQQTQEAFGDACRQGVRFAPNLVVYGHAALDQARFNAASGHFEFADRLEHIEQTSDGSNQPERISRIPLTRWHLARRATICQPWPAGLDPGYPFNLWFTQSSCQRIARCVPQPPESDLPGDGAYLDFEGLLRSFSADFFGVNDAPYLLPYRFPMDNPVGLWQQVNVNSVYGLLYASFSSHPQIPADFHHVATVIENPPPDLAANLGVHLLPGCAWFQVEFLMPEDPRNSPEYSPAPNVVVSQRTDQPLWTEVEPGETYVFVPDTAENRAAVANLLDASGRPTGRLLWFARLDQCVNYPHDSNVNPVGPPGGRLVRMWPYGLRITVRAIDPRGRLNEPLVRTVVHRFE
jgi:prepilin-type N-terminal cleavage/methylation domain-containing protein